MKKYALSLLLVVAVVMLATETGLWAVEKEAAPREGGFRRRPGSDGGRTAKPLTEAEQTKLMNFAKKYMPSFHKRLVELKKNDPKRFARTLQYHLAPKMAMLKKLPEDVRMAHTQHGELSIEIYKTAKAWKAAPEGKEKEALAAKLVTLTGQLVDAEQILHEHRLKMLEKQLEKLRAEVARRKAARAKIIAEKIKKTEKAAKEGTLGQKKKRRPHPRRPAPQAPPEPADE